MGELPQALEIIFEVKKKRSKEKIARRKINFPTYKMCFFFFSPSLWISLLSKLITFLFSCSFKMI
jgi:hypothetical protein